MSEEKKDELLHDYQQDGAARQGFLKCVAWPGTGAPGVMEGGVLKSSNLSRMLELGPKAKSILIERKQG
jgi:hypothetical protein